MHYHLQDADIEGPELFGHIDVPDEDSQQDDRQDSGDDEYPMSERRMAFSCQILANRGQGGLPSILIAEDGEPMSKAGFLILVQGDLFKLPFIGLDRGIKLQGEVRDDQVIAQLELARQRDREVVGIRHQKDF